MGDAAIPAGTAAVVAFSPVHDTSVHDTSVQSVADTSVHDTSMHEQSVADPSLHVPSAASGSICSVAHRSANIGGRRE